MRKEALLVLTPLVGVTLWLVATPARLGAG